MSSNSGTRMEDILHQLARDIITPKFSNIKYTAHTAIDLLQDEEKLKKIEAWELREICLQPLLLALESRARKLGHTALAGIQVMFKDDRFRSSLETSDEDKWLPSQVLTVLAVAHSLAEDLQIEVMKLLLNMTVTASWCTNARTIIKIAQMEVARTARENGGRTKMAYTEVVFFFVHSLAMVYIGSYQNCVMVQGAVQAAFITMINKFVGGLIEVEETVQVDDGDDLLADFKANNRAIPSENLISEIVLILTFLTDRLENVASTSEGKQTVPLLLEGVNTILAKVQSTIRHNSSFQELLWQRLCPCLISLLGEPKADKVSGSQKPGGPDVSKCTGTSLSSPNITQASAKVIYSIAGELASLVGGVPPLRPVLESLFHKILMFPLPQNRHDALKVLKELMSEPQKVVSLIGSSLAPWSNRDTGSSSIPSNNRDAESSISLLKMLVESVQQSSHLSDPAVVYTSVSCICSLLASLDKIRQGEAIPDSMLKPPKGLKTYTRRSMTSNPDDDGGSDLTCDLYDESEEPIPELVKESSAGENALLSEVFEDTKDGGKSVAPPPPPSRAKFEADERENAELFVRCLRQIMPTLSRAGSIWEVDELIQDIAAQFCSTLPQNSLESRSGNSVSGVVLNSDGVYVAAITVLKLNLRLLNSGFYMDRQNIPVSECDFLNEIFSSGLLLYLPPVWLKEIYSQVLGSSLLDVGATTIVSAVCRSSNPLINFLQDLEGIGTTEERGRLMSDFRQAQDSVDGDENDRLRRAEIGRTLAAGVLSACWTQILDILSVMLNDQVPTPGSGSMARYSLSLLLATDSAQEDVRRARSAICASLNGFQRAAKLFCVLGLQHLCGSVFSQLARTSCANEDFRATAVTENKVQGKASVLASNKPKLVKLHAAHLLSMDVVVTTGLEIGSHSADCWKHVFREELYDPPCIFKRPREVICLSFCEWAINQFSVPLLGESFRYVCSALWTMLFLRCCAHISELEHTYFSQGNNQTSLPKVLHGPQADCGQEKEGAEIDGNCNTDLYAGPVTAAVPVAPRINVPVLIQQSGLESGWDNSLAAGGVLTFAQASKALCGLSQEVDSLFEDAADKLCLEALLSFIMELGEAALLQLQRLAGTRTGGGVGSRLPTNALHMYRLQQVLVRVVNSPRPLLHLLRVWSVVSPYLVQAAANSDHVISKMAVTSIHEFIVSLVSQREERAHFHVNEFVCKLFEDMLCLELCDGDVQDQIVCCICELVEACSSQLQSGWRPLFGALRSVKIEYTTNEAVNEARQRHVAAVMDVFNVYLDMDNISVFASATVDCVLCLLKYVHGPATFDSELSDDKSDTGSDDGYGDAEGELENLCVPALKYLTRVCDILASMWHMPACPVFKGAHRIQTDSVSRSVDGNIPFMNFKDFAEEFSLDKYQNHPAVEADSKKEEDISSGQDKDDVAAFSQEADQNGREVPSVLSLSVMSEPAVSPDIMPAGCSGSAEPQEVSEDGPCGREMQEPEVTDADAIPTAGSARESGSSVEEQIYSGTARDSGSETAKDSGSEAAKDSGSETAKDSGSETAKDSGSETAKDSGSEADKDSGSETAKDSGSEAAKDSGSEAAKDSSSETAKDSGSETAKESGSEAVKNASFEAAKNSAFDRVKAGETSFCTGTRPSSLTGLDSCSRTGPPDGTGGTGAGLKESPDEDTRQVSSAQSLDDMDNESGVLHVWFLLMDGLVLAINHCPKAVQSYTLNTLIDLLRLAAVVPGPEFSLHCLNHLMLPMMQSWLRRGSRCYGYWNTGLNSFKQCCGLVADLVVEFVARFSGKPNLDPLLQLVLKQMFDVLTECVAQPVENISRLGCSCIRHILLSAGPHLSEQLWQVGALAIRRALSVSTYNLQLLMALFHPNSENFYGDIGQVKVATRKDCTVVDCLRLQQMAKQVFLLDSQISSMPDVTYDTDQDKSFVFLLYPPGHQDSLNPDHISTRIPFHHVVVGLLSNQLLLQTVGSILLEQRPNQENAKLIELPGMMAYMSTRNISQFLAALEDVFRLSQDFDARPGLKFLLQKVASLDVAANLYKQTATTVLFHVHALIEICAHLDNNSIGSTKAAITPTAETPQTPVAPPTITDLKQQANVSLAKPWTSGKLFIPLLQNICEELCQSYTDVLHDSGKGSVMDRISEKPIFFLTAQHDDISQITWQAQLAAQKTRLLEEQRMKLASLHRSRSQKFEHHLGAEGLGVSVAVTAPQTHENSDDDSGSEEEEVKSKESVTGVDEDEERVKSKREIRAELQSKVYTVATDQVIENLMSQYKRHKHQRSMPNFVRAPKFQKSKVKIPRKEPVDEAIDKLQKSSIMKDSEAHIQTWSDTLTAVLQMTMKLSDHSFSALLPVTFTFVSQLILHASDSALRDQLAQFFTRLGRMYDFAPNAVSSSCGELQVQPCQLQHPQLS